MGKLLRHSAALSLFLAIAGFAQAQEPAPTPPDTPLPAPKSSSKPLSFDEPRVGIGVKGSFLGGGVEGAVRVNRFANVRGGFNLFSYHRGFNKDSIDYAGQLDFKTVEGHFDIFPFAGKFHVSPGVLAYIGNPITATAAVPGGQSFSLGGTTYYSDTGTPVTGSGNIKFNQVSPMATFGWGNLVPRNHGHFSVPFELGAVFQGSPKATLGLAGNVCDSPGVNCRSVASDPTVQSNVLSEQNKLNNSMSFFKFYPIISIGFGYAF
jgi:hypothetical protein